MKKIKLIFYFRIKEFPCYVPGCQATFQTLFDYEMHYNSSHRYTCTECKASRPSPRLLEIHIQETHDAFFKIMAEKQAMVFICILFNFKLYNSFINNIFLII